MNMCMHKHSDADQSMITWILIWPITEGGHSAPLHTAAAGYDQYDLHYKVTIEMHNDCISIVY